MEGMEPGTPETPRGAALVLRLARVQYTPVILLPVLLGTALAFEEGVPLSVPRLLLALAGAFAAHLGANTLNDVHDFLTGADPGAETRDSRDFGGSDVLTRGWMSPSAAHRTAWLFFALAGGCGAALTFLAGWPVAALAAGGLFLAWAYVAPPVRYGYRGRGLGEAGIFLAFGPIPVLGGWYVQAETIALRPALASLPLAFLTTAILFNHHFTHVEGDRKAGKMSPVVVLGKPRALLVSKAVLAAAFLSVAGLVAGGVLPWPALAALLAAPLAAGLFRDVRPDSPVERFMALTGGIARVNLLAGILLILGVGVSRVLLL